MSEILSGCPFIENNEKKDCEVCGITGKPTGVSLTCDFDYDTDCSVYKNHTGSNSKVKK